MKLRLSHKLSSAALAGVACCTFATATVRGLNAATVISDDFNDGNFATGATTLPTSVWSKGGNVTETGGSVVLSTDAIGGTALPNQWSGSVLYTNGASSGLNLYEQTVTVSIRDLTLASAGDHAGSGGRFRFGIIPRDNQPYTTTGQGNNSFGEFFNNGNDGISFDITNTSNLAASSYTVRYKKDATEKATDPNTVPANGSASLGFVVTGLDFTASLTNWSVTFYGAAGQTSTASGVWSLGGMSTWGNATDGWGNSAFIMGVQNMGLANVSPPTASGNGWTTATVGSILVTAVPEPSRSLLACLAGVMLLGIRRRKAV